MIRSLYSGVTGLQNHQVRMDVIGNNVSNINTNGFKKGRVNFQDLISQTLQGAARPREEVGGVNPQQVGLGVQVASIDTLHTQGSLRTTGVKSDVALQGEGFLILRDGSRQLYTRSGTLGVDEQGTLVNPANGRRVQGWLAQVIAGQTIVDTSASLEDIVIPIGSKDPAAATTQVSLSSNLDKNTAIIPAVGPSAADIASGTWTVEYDVFDSFGANHTLRIDFTRVPPAPGASNANQWLAQVSVNPNDPPQPVPPVQTLTIGGAGIPGDLAFLVDFDNAGTLLQVSNAGGGLVGGIGADGTDLTAQLTFTVPETDGVAGAGALATQTLTIDLGQVGAFVDSLTQYASTSSARVFSQDGYGQGYLQDYRIDQSGTITGIYSNGTNRSIGQIALASFTNPGGLEKDGSNDFLETINSGLANIGVSGTASRGTLIAGALELSNVDLAEEFTDMIVTQRGFQANSRTITTSDQLLQELLTLKR